jgi:hypothetical protein
MNIPIIIIFYHTRLGPLSRRRSSITQPNCLATPTGFLLLSETFIYNCGIGGGFSLGSTKYASTYIQLKPFLLVADPLEFTRRRCSNSTVSTQLRSIISPCSTFTVYRSYVRSIMIIIINHKRR